MPQKRGLGNVRADEDGEVNELLRNGRAEAGKAPHVGKGNVHQVCPGSRRIRRVGTNVTQVRRDDFDAGGGVVKLGAVLVEQPVDAELGPGLDDPAFRAEVDVSGVPDESKK